MHNQKKNFLVGLFVLIGILGIVWMLVKFQDLPARLNRYGASEITIHFPSAFGIGVNAPVYFRGYSIGRVVEVKPPALIAATDDPEKKAYKIAVITAIDEEFQIPRSAIAKAYTGGLGSGHLEFVVRDDHIGDTFLADGDVLEGQIALASQFIPEETQMKFDNLLDSLNTFFAPADQAGDDADPTQTSRVNLQSLVQRFDETLENLNTVIGDTENQENIRTALTGFADSTEQLQKTIEETRNFMAEASQLIQQASGTLGTIDQTTRQFSETYGQLGEKAQNTADQLSATLKSLDRLFTELKSGTGTAAKMVNDPRLYESLVDTTETLTLAIQEFRELLAELNEHGIVGFKGK